MHIEACGELKAFGEPRGVGNSRRVGNARGVGALRAFQVHKGLGNARRLGYTRRLGNPGRVGHSRGVGNSGRLGNIGFQRRIRSNPERRVTAPVKPGTRGPESRRVSGPSFSEYVPVPRGQNRVDRSRIGDGAYRSSHRGTKAAGACFNASAKAA